MKCMNKHLRIRCEKDYETYGQPQVDYLTLVLLFFSNENVLILDLTFMCFVLVHNHFLGVSSH